MLAQDRFVLCAQGGYVCTQAGGIFAIWLETWVLEQMVESQGPTERWPLAFFLRSTTSELPKGEHQRAILRLPAGVRRIIGAPAVVTLPGIRVVLGGNLNRLEGV